MKQQDNHPPSASLQQVYLIDRDAGLMCRILGLYAARGIDLSRVEYAYAAQDVMSLKVSVADPGLGQFASQFDDIAESIRVLVDKAASFVGVLAAAEQPRMIQRAA